MQPRGQRADKEIPPSPAGHKSDCRPPHQQEQKRHTMQIIITSDRLKSELAFVRSVINEKSTIPTLQNVHLMTSNKAAAQGVLRMTGTDLDHTIICDTEAKVVEPGIVCVRAGQLFKIAAELPAGKEVTIKSEPNHWAQITCERSQFKIAGTKPEDFPEIASVKEDAVRIQMSAERMRTFITRTIFAITQEESRYTLSGALLNINKHRDQMVTTDGHRLSVIEGNGMNREGLSKDTMALITRKTLQELMKLTSGMKAEIEFSRDDNHLHFNFGARQLIARQLTGTFPNWEMIVPKDMPFSAAVDVLTLKQALSRVSLMTENRSPSTSFHFSKGELTMAAQTAEEGEAHEVVEIEGFTGEDTDIKLNPDYVMDPLNALSNTDVVQFMFKDGQSPVLIRVMGETGLSYQVVVMPMR